MTSLACVIYLQTAANESRGHDCRLLQCIPRVLSISVESKLLDFDEPAELLFDRVPAPFNRLVQARHRYVIVQTSVASLVYRSGSVPSLRMSRYRR